MRVHRFNVNNSWNQLFLPDFMADHTVQRILPVPLGNYAGGQKLWSDILTCKVCALALVLNPRLYQRHQAFSLQHSFSDLGWKEALTLSLGGYLNSGSDLLVQLHAGPCFLRLHGTGSMLPGQ